MKAKHILSIAAVAVITIFSSCRKDYTCTCTVNNEAVVILYNQEHKKDAEKGCEARETAAKMTDAQATCAISEK